MDLDEAAPLARQLVALVADEPGLRMALLTGSAARGLADASSDIDVYLYWDDVDVDRLSLPGRFATLGATRRFGIRTAGGWFEKLRHGDRYVDVEHVAIATIGAAADSLAAGRAPSGSVAALAAGVRDAVAVHGEAELTGWQQRLRYGDENAAAEVAARAPRLLAPTALYELTGARGDALACSARLSRLLLDVVGLLGAVNRRFVPLEDPKWLPWHVAGFEHAPADLVGRIEAGLRAPSPATMGDLDLVVAEVLDLVDRHVPGADTAGARFATALRPRPAG